MQELVVDRIDFLVRRKYPSLSGGQIPPSITRGTAARSSGSYKTPFEAAQQYRAYLLNLSEEQLTAVYDGEMQKLQEEIAAKEQAHFFNQPRAKADFDHWSRAAHWTLEEAVALSFGKEPSIVNSRSLAAYRNISPFPGAFAKRLDLARRAVPWEKLYDPVLPGIFIGWARDNEICFPADLEALVKARGNFVGSWKGTYESLKEQYDALLSRLDELREAHARERDALVAQRDQALAEVEESRKAPPHAGPSARETDSLLKLVIGLAIGGYGYDPRATRNAKASEMATDLATAGVPLDDDTIRKWLRAAAGLLPPPESE